VRRALKRAEKVRGTDVWPQLFFTKNGLGKPRKKTYITRVKKGIVPDTFWADDDYEDPVDIGSVSWDASDSGTSETGARELGAIVGDDHGFETVKPIKLLPRSSSCGALPTGSSSTRSRVRGRQATPSSRSTQRKPRIGASS
jgi:adenine-specific DNA-methyltransferase